MHSAQRRVYFYDIQVGVNKKAATPPSIREIVQALEDRWKEKKAFHPINKGRAYLEIGDIRIDKVNNCAIFLVRISDKSAPDPYFSNPEAGTSRVERKRTGEGRGYGAHLLISLEQESGRPNNYLALFEKNQGVHQSLVMRLLQAVLRGQYKDDDEPFSCPDISGARDRAGNAKMVKFRPMLEFVGHPSDVLLAELEGGILKGVQLLDGHQKGQLGSPSWLEQGERAIKFKAKGRISVKTLLPEIKKFVSRSTKEGFRKARVRFEKPDKTTEDIEIDVATGNFLEDRYVKTRLIREIDPVMDDSADAIVEHFASRLVEQLIEHRASTV